jgi:DNA-binding transcriptional LysR family regulator
VMQCVMQGSAVGVLPLFLAAEHPALRALTEPLEDASTDLWLLMHPEARHLRRISIVYAHLAQEMRVP